MKRYIKSIRTALLFSIGMLVICGVLYPLALTGVSQVFFKDKANGSLIEINGKVVGSKIVGQKFEDDKFFKGRPSAVNYNTYTEEEKENGDYGGVASGSNNYAPSNPDLKARMEADIQSFLDANPSVERSSIPEDLVTASGSGLDPHISVEAAKVQVAAIAKASGLSQEDLNKIIENNTTDKVAGVFGEATVNVLQCNLDIAKKLNLI
ncbi:K(+)-transporting ATPase subunit C [Amedibacillus sp. YH-ame10]